MRLSGVLNPEHEISAVRYSVWLSAVLNPEHEISQYGIQFVVFPSDS